MPLNPRQCQANPALDVPFARAGPQLLPPCRDGACPVSACRVPGDAASRVSTGDPVRSSGNFRNLIVELVKNADRGVKNFLIHLTIRSDGFGQRDGNNLVSAQRRHLPEFAAVHHVDGAQSVARGQYAVESAGRSASLDVAEYNRPRLEASPFFDLARHGRADSAQPKMPELIAPFLQN